MDNRVLCLWAVSISLMHQRNGNVLAVSGIPPPPRAQFMAWRMLCALESRCACYPPRHSSPWESVFADPRVQPPLSEAVGAQLVRAGALCERWGCPASAVFMHRLSIKYPYPFASTKRCDSLSRN